jgi:hypothetical protein
MSKMDALRAMREARYEEAARAARPARTTKPATATAPKPTKAKDEPPTPPPVADAGLCGHRAISGRTCTREAGHAAKSHRYS